MTVFTLSASLLHQLHKMILEKFKGTNEVARETGVSVSTVRKYLKLLKLAPSIQAKLTTKEGPAGIGTLSKLAETFPADEQVEVLERIAGFRQNIQLEMLKRSEGDIGKIEGLREQALEGEFDTHLCRSLNDCIFIPKKLLETVEKAIKESKQEI